MLLLAPLLWDIAAVVLLLALLFARKCLVELAADADVVSATHSNPPFRPLGLEPLSIRRKELLSSSFLEDNERIYYFLSLSVKN